MLPASIRTGPAIYFLPCKAVSQYKRALLLPKSTLLPDAFLLPERRLDSLPLGPDRPASPTDWRSTATLPPMIDIYVDGDACPVKDEIYQVAARHGVYVLLVANSAMRIPDGAGVEMVVVDDGPDAADDWIAEHIRSGDVAVTADIPLAARCLQTGARVLGTQGEPFTEDSIGGALATRELKSDLREAGVATGGPPPLSQRDRARFLGCLERLVQQGLAEAG